MVFEVPLHLQCGAWQTQMKMDNEFQIFCFAALVFDVETQKCWNAIVILA